MCFSFFLSLLCSSEIKSEAMLRHFMHLLRCTSHHIASVILLYQIFNSTLVFMYIIQCVKLNASIPIEIKFEMVWFDEKNKRSKKNDIGNARIMNLDSRIAVIQLTCIFIYHDQFRSTSMALKVRKIEHFCPFNCCYTFKPCVRDMLQLIFLTSNLLRPKQTLIATHFDLSILHYTTEKTTLYTNWTFSLEKSSAFIVRSEREHWLNICGLINQ